MRSAYFTAQFRLASARPLQLMRARVRHNLSSRLSAAEDPVIPMSPRSCDHVTTLRIWEDARVDLEDLRLAVYRSFARTGRPPRAGDLAERLALDVATVRAGLAALAGAATWSSARPARSSWHTRSPPCRWASRSWAGRRCGGAAARRTPSHCHRCSRTRARSSCPPDAQPAPIRTPGTSAPSGHQTAIGSPTFSCPPRTCGMTSSTRAGTSACSAPKSVLTRGAGRPDPRAATSWIFARCGGSPPTGMTHAWTAATSGGSRKRRQSTCEPWDSRARSGACDPPCKPTVIHRVPPAHAGFRAPCVADQLADGWSRFYRRRTGLGTG